jgi:nucleoside-diphosphate kinase
MLERTLIILKPDAVKRKLCGKIISMFEEAGFNIVDAKLITPSRELVDRHYPNNNKWYIAVGNKSISNFTEQGLNISEVMGTDDALTIGKKIKEWLIDYMTSGPVMAMVLEGNNAIKNVRKMCGNTIPASAEPSTIRGRFSIDSSDVANAEHRPVHNLIHASGEVDEAKYEISLWFGNGES